MLSYRFWILGMAYEQQVKPCICSVAKSCIHATPLKCGISCNNEGRMKNRRKILIKMRENSRHNSSL